VALIQRQAQVSYHDPYVPTLQLDDVALHSVPLTREVLAGQIGVVVITDHSVFDWDEIARHAHLIVDTRNALKSTPNYGARVVRL